MTIICF